jgi:DNA-binding winged helix-turn-helix (wHTH) protein
MPKESSHHFKIGSWQVDRTQGRLSRDGREVRIEPRLMDLLLAFAEAPGIVLSKDDVVARVWAGRAVGDDTLAAAISRLRSALGETKDERYIETLPKRGYRLLAPVGGFGEGSVADRRRPATASLVEKGYASLRLMLPPTIAQARLYFESAVKEDPTLADAQAGLAETMLVQLMGGQGRGGTLAGAAKAAATAAVALDEHYAPGWSVLGLATLIADRDFEASNDALLKALRLDPALSSAHRNRAFAFSTKGAFAEAEREARRAAELEPFSLSARNDLLQTLLASRKFGHAIAEARHTIALGASDFQAWSAKGWAHAFMGDFEEAVSSLIESLKAMGSDDETRAGLVEAFSTGGFEAFCKAGGDLFERQRVLFTPRPLDIAMLRAQSGESDKAFTMLERALEQDDPVLLLAPYLPHLDRIRNDPRFARLLERVRPVR